MTNVMSAVAFLGLLISSVPGHATGRLGRDLTSALIFYGEIPAGSKLALSVANVAPKRDASHRSTCDKVEAILRVLGTLGPIRERSGVETLEIVHQGFLDDDLAPGQVQPVEFLQASSTTETVMIQVITSERAARCLAYSSVTLLNAAGDLVSVVPVDPIRGVVVILDTGSSGRCCDCAPICGCGICD